MHHFSLYSVDLMQKKIIAKLRDSDYYYSWSAGFA